MSGFCLWNSSRAFNVTWWRPLPPHQDIRKSTFCAIDGKAVRPRVAEIAALKSTFFIFITPSEREVLFSFCVKNMTLVHLKREIHLTMKPLINHWLSLIGRDSGGQFVVRDLQVHKEFVAHVLPAHHHPATAAVREGLIRERYKFRAHAVEDLLTRVSRDFL